MKNESLIRYFRPASKPSTQILAAVAAWVADHQFHTNWLSIEHEGWRLPCTRDKYDWCGIWQTLGCLNKTIHEMFGKGKSVFIKHYQRSCYRPSCKECYLKWIARAANRATRRIENYAQRTGQIPIHLMLMVNKSQYSLPEKLLRKRMMDILELALWEGGAVIFHPFKFNDATREFYYSPHFHLVGFGRRDMIARAFGRYGWYVKTGEERKSVFQTFCYLLSHCGIKKGRQAVIWIGELSYSKVPSEKEPKSTGCPVCGCPLIVVWHEGIHPKVPPDRHFEGLLDDDNCWHPVETEKRDWNKIEQYEYALREDLYYVYDIVDSVPTVESALEVEKCYVCNVDLGSLYKTENGQKCLFSIPQKPLKMILWNRSEKNVCSSCYVTVQECLLTYSNRNQKFGQIYC